MLVPVIQTYSTTKRCTHWHGTYLSLNFEAELVHRWRLVDVQKAYASRSYLRPNKDRGKISVSLSMAHVVTSLDLPSNYKDSQARVDRQKQYDLLSKSTTLYVSLLLI
jgi:hypothetical protein